MFGLIYDDHVSPLCPTVITCSVVTDGRPSDTPVDPLVPKTPPPPFEPERLQKQIDHAIGDHRTSASMINAVVGGISTKGTQCRLARLDHLG